LVITINDTKDSVMVYEWYSDLWQVEHIKFADGTVWDAAAIKQLALVNHGTYYDDQLMGTSTDDVLSGLEGNDYIDGCAGDITMYGGQGNDEYNVYSQGDTIIEYANEGNDSVYSSISYTLPDNVENLYLLSL